MPYPIVNGAVVNGGDGVGGAAQTTGIDLATRASPAPVMRLGARPAAVRALELGAQRVVLGVDTVVSPNGIDVARTGVHSVLYGQPPAAVALQAAGGRPLEVGTARAALGSTALAVAGYIPLLVGAPTARVSLGAASAQPLSLGDPVVHARLDATGAVAIDVGRPYSVCRAHSAGIDLARTGMHSVRSGNRRLAAGGARALDVGTPGVPANSLRARATFPMASGRPRIDRGLAC